MLGARLDPGACVQEVCAEDEVEGAQMRSCIPVSPVQLAGSARHPVEAQVLLLYCDHLRSQPDSENTDMCWL